MSEELKRSKIAIIMKIAQFKIQSKYNLKFSGETRLDDGKETLSSIQPKFKPQDRTFVQHNVLKGGGSEFFLILQKLMN